MADSRYRQLTEAELAAVDLGELTGGQPREGVIIRDSAAGRPVLLGRVQALVLHVRQITGLVLVLAAAFWSRW